jgi:Fur family ferric uptake transcriptional regulator
MQSWSEHAERRLAEAGFRRGGARAAVIGLLDHQACALSAYDIEDALRGDGRGVARASVYRVLEELVGLGLVTRVEVGQDSARY